MSDDKVSTEVLTMAEGALRLNAAFMRVGAALATALHAVTAANLATERAAAWEIEAFRSWCRACQIDPEPSLQRMKASRLPIFDFLAAERKRLSR